jgi:hypothetical protein
MDFTFPIVPKQFLKIAMRTSLGVVMLSLFINVLCLLFSHDLSPVLRGLRWLLDVDREDNLPTFYSVLLLISSGILLGCLAWIKHQYRDRYTWQWAMLGVIFLGMAWDEATELHETLVVLNREHNYLSALGLPSGGIFHFAWVLVGLLFVLGLAIVYFPVWRSLPAQQKKMLLLSAGVYLTGVLGMEMVGGLIVSGFGLKSVPYMLGTHVEELLEMLGMNLFAYSLLQYIARYGQKLQFQLLPLQPSLHPEIGHTLPDIIANEPMQVNPKHLR